MIAVTARRDIWLPAFELVIARIQACPTRWDLRCSAHGVGLGAFRRATTQGRNLVSSAQQFPNGRDVTARVIERPPTGAGFIGCDTLVPQRCETRETATARRLGAACAAAGNRLCNIALLVSATTALVSRSACTHMAGNDDPAVPA